MISSDDEQLNRSLYSFGGEFLSMFIDEFCLLGNLVGVKRKRLVLVSALMWYHVIFSVMISIRDQ